MYGSMAPAPMQFPGLMPQKSPMDQGMAILQAALKSNPGGLGLGGSNASPGFGAGVPGPDGTGAPPMSPVGGGMMGMLSKLFGQQFGLPGAPNGPGFGPVNPNSGMPVTPDVMAGAGGMGGGPAPTALTGLW